MVPLSESERQEVRKGIATAILAPHFEDPDELQSLVCAYLTDSVEMTSTYPTESSNANGFSSSPVPKKTKPWHAASTGPAIPRPDTNGSAPPLPSTESPKTPTVSALPTVPDVAKDVSVSPVYSVSYDHLPDAESPETTATEYAESMDESWGPNPDAETKEDPISHTAQDEMAGMKYPTEETQTPHMTSEPPTDTDNIMLDAEPQPTSATAPTHIEVAMPDAVPQPSTVTAPTATTASSSTSAKRKYPDSGFDEFQAPRRAEKADEHDDKLASLWQSVSLLRQCAELYTKNISRPMGGLLQCPERRLCQENPQALGLVDYLKVWLHNRLKKTQPDFKDTDTYWVVVKYLERFKEELSRGQHEMYREWLTEALIAYNCDLLQVRPVEGWEDGCVSRLREKRMEEVFKMMVLNNWRLASSYDPTKANQAVRVMTFDEMREEVERADVNTFRAAAVSQHRETTLKTYESKTDAREKLWKENAAKSLQWLKQNVPGAIQTEPALASVNQAPKRAVSTNNTPAKKRRGGDVDADA